MTEDVISAATYAAWRTFARFTPIRFDHRLHRNETQEEAMRRRFDALPFHTVEQFRREALAVLSVAENYGAAA